MKDSLTDRLAYLLAQPTHNANIIDDEDEEPYGGEDFFDKADRIYDQRGDR